MTPTLTQIADTVRATLHPDQLSDLKVHPDCVTYTVLEIGDFFIVAVPRDGGVCDMMRTHPDDEPILTQHATLDAYASCAG